MSTILVLIQTTIIIIEFVYSHKSTLKTFASKFLKKIRSLFRK